MNLKPIILAMAAVAATPAAIYGQLNSKQSGGFATRAAAMLADGNFQGCVDQCNMALELGTFDREQVCWMRAVATFKEGAPASRELLKSFARQFPASTHMPAARLLLATLTFYDGDFSAALAEFEKINRNSLQADEAEDLDYRTAYCLMKLGQSQRALGLMDKLAETSRYGAPARFYQGYIAYVEGDYAKAEPLLLNADTSSVPGNMAPYYIGQIQFHDGRYSEACTTMQPLISRPDFPEELRDEAERISGESLYALGRPDQGLVLLNSYIEKHPDDAPLSARYIVGLDRYESGNYQQAIRLLAPVSELSDAMGQSAALTIGQSYMAEGNTAAALMQFEKATHLDFDPKVTELAYYNYAVARVDGGRVPFGNSVQLLEEFIKRYPRSSYAATVQNYLVKGYMSTDDYEGALRSLNSLTNNSPQILQARQRVNFVLGTRALQRGDAAGAINYLRNAQKYSSQDADIERQTFLWLGDALYALSDYSAARKSYLDFLRLSKGNDANRPTALYNLGYALFAQKDYTGARLRFQSAFDSKTLPEEACIDCLNRIADTYSYDKEFDKALTNYRRAYDLNPRLGDYSLLQIAMMDGYKGNQNDKVATLDRLIAEFPASALRPQAMTEKAVTLTAIGRSKDAESSYEAVIREYPSTAQGRNALLQLAIINRNGGDLERARQYYKQVISRHPSSSEAAMAVQDLKIIYGNEGNIDELNDFLVAIDGAPQLDAVERNAIAAAGLLRKARGAKSNTERRSLALQFLSKYPDAEGAEEALAIAAQAEYEEGLADKALEHFSELEDRASTSAMRHTAKMGIIRAARDMGENTRVIEVSQQMLSSSAIAGSDLQEIKFIRATSLAAIGHESDAMSLWNALAKTPANIYGTRSLYEISDAQFRNGKLNQAATAAEKLIDANPPHPYWLARTFILYSDILRAQGSDFEADEYLKALRQNYPGTDADIFQMIDQRLAKK